MARTSLLLVLTAITVATDAWEANVDDAFGPPISPAELAAAMANPSLREPPPEHSNAIENSGLFQGDIALTPEQQAELDKGRSAIRGQIWKNGVIPYTISPEFTYEDRQIIAAAMVEFSARTCLSFVGRTYQDDYINIINGIGCSSKVGRAGGEQELSLKQNECVYFGIVIHEFMHAAGFQHEQSRYDRDSYVIINWENIVSGKSHNFDKQSEIFTTDLGLPYDYTSVMHYDAYAFSANGQPTITSRQAGQTLGQRDGFSELDVEGLNLLYKCDGGSGCTDDHENCQSWAEAGECENTPDYMLTVCQKSCGSCGCTDNHENCQSWAEAGECEKDPDYMLTVCQKSCGSCECVDNNADCPGWAESGECQKNPDYMLTECAKSCDSCDAVKQTTKEPEVTTKPPVKQTTKEPEVTTKPPNKCKAKSKCTKKRGSCQPKKSTCDGKKYNKWCSKTGGCVCCVAAKKCKDKHENCANWKEQGRCKIKKYKKIMKKKCPKSCNKC